MLAANIAPFKAPFTTVGARNSPCVSVEVTPSVAPTSLPSPGEVRRYATEKIEGAFHGAGDVYVSALVGALARGIALDAAVAIAAEFTKDSIKQTALDKTEARYGLNSESRMFAYLTALERAAKKS